MARIWVPLPDRDFDPTELAVPWKVWHEAGHEVVFATETGAVPACDPLLIDGVVFGQLGAAPDALAAYREVESDPAFKAPVRWDAVDPAAFDALHLTGGHAEGMKQYLGSAALQAHVAAFFALGRPVSAICHGVLLAARSIGADGRSVLYGRRTTCLPAYMERTAYLLTSWKLGTYYRTYPAYVEEEVRAALASPDHFERGPTTLITRGTDDDDRGTFVVTDGSYVSARWPGDAWALAKAFLPLLTAGSASTSTAARSP